MFPGCPDEAVPAIAAAQSLVREAHLCPPLLKTTTSTVPTNCRAGISPHCAGELRGQACLVHCAVVIISDCPGKCKCLNPLSWRAAFTAAWLHGTMRAVTGTWYLVSYSWKGAAAMLPHRRQRDPSASDPSDACPRHDVPSARRRFCLAGGRWRGDGMNPMMPVRARPN